MGSTIKTLSTADLLDEYECVARHFGLYNLSNYFLNKILHIKETNYSNSNHIKIGETLFKMGKIKFILGDYNASVGFYQKALKIKKFYYGYNSLEITDTLDSIGMAKIFLGNYDDSKKFYNKSMQIKKTHHRDREHTKFSETLLGLGLLERRFGYLNKAKELFTKSLNIKKSYYKNNDHKDMLSSLGYLSLTEIYLCNYAAARNIINKAIKIKNIIYKNDSILTDKYLQTLAILEWSVGNYQKAKETFRKVLEIRKEHYLNSDHIMVAYPLQGLGLVEFSMGNYKEAKKILKKDIKIREKFYKSNNHVALGSSLLTLGFTDELLGNYSEVLCSIQRAYNILSKYYKNRINSSMSSDYTPAIIWPDLNITNFLGAIKYYEKTLPMIKLIFGKDYHFTARYHYLLGQSYEKHGEKLKARKQYEKALLIAKKILSDIKDNDVKSHHQKNILSVETKISKLS